MTKFTFKYLDYSQKNNLWFNTSLSVKFYSTESKQSTDQMKESIALSLSERKVLDNLGFDTNSLLQFDDVRSPHLNWDKSSSNHIKEIGRAHV